jgi:hypothetical protein
MCPRIANAHSIIIIILLYFGVQTHHGFRSVLLSSALIACSIVAPEIFDYKIVF